MDTDHKPEKHSLVLTQPHTFEAGLTPTAKAPAERAFLTYGARYRPDYVLRQ